MVVEIVHIPIGKNTQLKNEHDYLDYEMLINNPWIFDINIPTENDSAVVALMYYLLNTNLKITYSIFWLFRNRVLLLNKT